MTYYRPKLTNGITCLKQKYIQIIASSTLCKTYIFSSNEAKNSPKKIMFSLAQASEFNGNDLNQYLQIEFQHFKLL